MGRHRKFNASFKAKVAIAALQEKESLTSLATKYGLSPTVIQQWREELEQSEIADLELYRPAGMSRHRYCRMMHFTRSNLYPRTMCRLCGKG